MKALLSIVITIGCLFLGIQLIEVINQHVKETRFPQTWSYQMSGNLDSDNLTCSGIASVHKSEEACWSWDLPHVACVGNHNVDWLHYVEDSGKICRASDEWELQTVLPGNSFCIVYIEVENASPAKGFELSCVFQCRTGSFPCEGSATYEFSPSIAFSRKMIQYSSLTIGFIDKQLELM